MKDENEEKIYEDFGIRLRELRRSKKKTQKELAEEMGISQTAVAQYEAGTRRLPLSILKKFSNYFELTLDDLIMPNEVKKQDTSFKHQLSKYEVATELGFTKEEITILESGVKQIPTTFFEKFANYFDIDIHNLTAFSLDNQRNHAVITNDEVLTERYKKWQLVIGYNNHFTDEEIDQLIDYAKYLISKRK